MLTTSPLAISIRNRKVALARWRNHRNKVYDYIAQNQTSATLVLKARLCGYLAGDGSVTERHDRLNNKMHYDIFFYPDNEVMMQKYLESFHAVYGKTPTVKSLKNYYRVRIACKAIYTDLLRTAKFGTLEWNVPKFITTQPQRIEWLRAIFDAEAHVSSSDIRFQSVNFQGIQSIKTLLNQFGIISKIYTYERHHKNWNTNYILVIPTRFAQNFLNRIGFYHSRKQAKLIALVARVG